MKKNLKQVIAIMLTVVMLLSAALMNLYAGAETYDNPVIVVNGIANNPLYANPNTTDATQIFPLSDITMVDMTAQMFFNGMVTMLTNEIKETMDYFTSPQCFGMLEPIQLNSDGTSMSENIGPIICEKALSYYVADAERFETIAGSIGIGMCDRVGAENVYVYNYDWRLDPIESAHGLHDFIQSVKANSRREKVSIISEGYGSSVATAYLAEHCEDATADVDNFVTVNSAAMGTSLVGDFFTGRLIRQYNELQNATSAFIRYKNDCSDNLVISNQIIWINNYILNKNGEISDFIAQNITMMAHVIDPLYDNYLRDILKNFTGLWAMVPIEYYEKAIDFMLINDIETGDLQERIQAYKNIQSSVAEILNNAKSEGININVVSCWDLQLVPIGDNKTSGEELFGLSAQSDGLVDTYFSSFGCYTIPLNDVGAAAQNKDQRNTEGECENHNHLNSVYDSLNPDGSLGAICHYLDASTCALSDNTWFIRDMKFGSFDTASNSMDFLEYLVTADKNITVYADNGVYSQFMSYNRYVNPGYITDIVNNEVESEEETTDEMIHEEPTIKEENTTQDNVSHKPEQDHSDKDHDGFCDDCKYDLTEDCQHICHGNNIKKLFWTIFRFIYRLFGDESQHYCSCGQAHW